MDERKRLLIRASFSARYWQSATDDQMRDLAKLHDARCHINYNCRGGVPFTGYRTTYIWKREIINAMLMAEFYKQTQVTVNTEVRNLEIEIKEWDALPPFSRFNDKSKRILDIKKIVRKDLLNRLVNARYRQLKLNKFVNTRLYKVVKIFLTDKTVKLRA